MTGIESIAKERQRQIAPKDYDHRFEDHPFPRRNWWPWVALVAVLVVVWVVNA